MKDLRNKFILGALIGFAVVIALLLYTDLQSLGAYISEFPMIFLVPIVLFTLLNYVIRWVKWEYFLKLVGVSNLKKIDSIGLWVSGFVLALTPGKIGELLKAVILRSMTGTPVERGAPIIIAERVTDGLAMMLLAATGFGGILLTSAENNQVLKQYIPVYFTVLAVLLLGIILLQIRPLMLTLLEGMARLPLIGRFSRSFNELYNSSYELFRPRVVVVAVLLGVLSWIWECLGFFLILWGLGLEPTWLLVWQAMFMLAIATVIGAISGLPGGLGAAEISIIGMVQLLVLQQPDTGFAGTASLLVRISTLWFAVVLGLIMVFFFRHRLFPDKVNQVWRSELTFVD